MSVPAKPSRWDIDLQAQTDLPFGEGITQVNLRRIELACLLEIATGALEYAMNLSFGAMYGGVLVSLLGIPLARHARTWPSHRARHALVIVFIIIAFAMKQWGFAELGARGRLSTGYILTLMTLTLIFLVPPRTMGLLMGAFFVSYTAIIVGLPVSPSDKTVSIVNAAIVSVIALIACKLIFHSRRSDHEQKILIRDQNERLVAQNEELDQLMAITAHDLRSPLYGLRNLFDLATRRAEREPSLPLKVLHDGIYSLDAMIALVTRLLHAHAAEHGPSIAVVRDDLRGHLIAAARRVDPQAIAARITVKLVLPDQLMSARFDAGALSQILDNLLSNAVRFSPPGSAVTLACTAADARSIVSISDCGPGIEPALRPALFTKFGRGAGPDGGDTRGSGMGLFIAARLAERMGAWLTFREGNAGGSVFEMSFPLE